MLYGNVLERRKNDMAKDVLFTNRTIFLQSLRIVRLFAMQQTAAQRTMTFDF